MLPMGKKKDKKKEKKKISQHKQNLQRIKQKQTGIALILLGSLLCFTVVLFLYYGVLIVRGMPELIPEKETKFFMQIDTRHTPLSKPQKESLKTNISNWLERELSIDFEKTIEPYSTGLWGIAYITTGTENEEAAPLFIVEQKKDNPLPIESLEEISDEIYYGNVGLYMLLSRNSELIDWLSSDISSGHESTLANSFVFLKAVQGFPQQNLAYFFAHHDFIEGYEAELTFTLPDFASIGGYIIPRNKSFFAEMHAELNHSYRPKGYYSGELLAELPDGPSFVLGGTNPLTTLSIRKQNKITAFFEQFGISDISLKDDIMPLLEEEYALAFYNKNDFIFTTKKNTDEKKSNGIETLKRNIPTIISVLAPSKRTIDLPDGSTGDELYANQKDVTTQEATMAEIPLTIYSKDGVELALAEKNDRILFSNNQELLISLLNGEHRKKFNESEEYKELISDLFRGIQSIAFLSNDFTKTLNGNGLSLGVQYGENSIKIFASTGT
jgi:hypothetical protein